MPKLAQIGRNIGVNIRIAGVGSMKVPTTRSSRFIIRRMAILLLVSPKSTSAIIAGILVKLIIQLMMDDTPIMNITIAVIFTLSSRILLKSLILMLR